MLAPPAIIFLGAPSQEDTGLKKGTKLLGIFALVVGVLALYLAAANLLFWVGVASMPLGSLNSAFALTLIVLSVLGSIVVNRRRVLENAQ